MDRQIFDADNNQITIGMFDKNNALTESIRHCRA